MMWDEVAGASRVLNGWLAIQVELWKADRADPLSRARSADPECERLLRATDRIARAATVTRAALAYVALGEPAAATDTLVRGLCSVLGDHWKGILRAFTEGPRELNGAVEQHVGAVCVAFFGCARSDAGPLPTNCATAVAALDGLLSYLGVAVGELARP